MKKRFGRNVIAVEAEGLVLLKLTIEHDGKLSTAWAAAYAGGGQAVMPNFEHDWLEVQAFQDGRAVSVPHRFIPVSVPD